MLLLRFNASSRKWPNQSTAANGLSAVRSSVAGVRERTVRSTAAAEAVAELGVVRPLAMLEHFVKFNVKRA